MLFTRRTAPVAAIVVVVAIFLSFPILSGFFADLWWFREIGYEVVFVRQLVTRIALFLGVGLAVAALLLGNLWFAQRGATPKPFAVRVGDTGQVVDVTASVQRLARPVAIGLAVFFGLGSSAAWDRLLLFANQSSFGITDPIFARDVSFYVFTLPAVGWLLSVLSTLAALCLVLVVPLYVLRGDIVMQPQRLRIEPTAGLHLSGLLAAFFVLTALSLWFVDVPGLLFSSTGPLIGASYTDLHARLPALRISAVLAILVAVLVVVGGVRRRLGWYAFLGVGGYAIFGILGRGAFPAIMQKFVVSPTELTRERPYLAHHILATRQAWGLDSVESRDLEGEANLTLASIRANGPTIDNVRLWDRAPLLRTFGQLQEIRTYYDFMAVDDDRYWIDGKYRQVLLSPRELNVASLPTRTFINEHLTFTHGMGLTMSPVNQVTAEGLPVLFIKDLPPTSTVSLSVKRPQIYFGELANPFVFVGTRQREFDYPAGDANVYSAYKGSGGVQVGNLVKRALLATYFGSLNVLLSGDITSESRVLYNRNIALRVAKALPFLQLDRDPYLVVATDGTLKWIQDAYTTTNRYPYSFRTPEGATYMRNSVKVVIDAYDGSLTAYVFAPEDAIVRTWAKIYPGILVPMDSMPADLRAHIRYPDDLYRTQAGLYTTYHMDKPEDFYHREDQWQIPVVTREDGSVPFMRHIVMRLPDESEAEFIYMAPFTPRGKDNLAAWMVARSDGANYGKLRVYRLPKNSLVFGPRQIENRINQDTEIARQVSLWDQRGSQVIRGDLLVIPIDEALLYVQPIYLQSEGGRIPELKRVVVAYQGQVVMRETLDAALEALFGGTADTPVRTQVAGAANAAGAAVVAGAKPSASDTAFLALVGEARRRFQAAIEAQRAGDWARYGEELRQLGELLERMGAGR